MTAATWSRRQRIIRVSPWTEQDGTVSRIYLVLFGKLVFRVLGRTYPSASIFRRREFRPGRPFTSWWGYWTWHFVRRPIRTTKCFVRWVRI